MALKPRKPVNDQFTDAVAEANAVILAATAYRAAAVAADVARANAQSAAAAFAV